MASDGSPRPNDEAGAAAAEEPASPSAQPAQSSAETTGSAAAPFSVWRVALDEQLADRTEAVCNAVDAVHARFEADAVFVRGEAGWRRQVTALGDQLDAAVRLHLAELRTAVASHGDAAAASLNESVARCELESRRELAQQAKMYQDKLRRTRSSLKKEMDRFAALEQCLRTEQARQAAALHDQQVVELTQDHADREAHLHAVLCDLRAAYSNLEMANEQLFEALQSSRRDAEQLKATLLNLKFHNHNNTRRKSATSPRGKNDSPPRRVERVKDSPTVSVVAQPLPVVAQPLPVVVAATEMVAQPLRQALDAAAKEVDRLKSRVAELEKSEQTANNRLSNAQDQIAHTQAELTKVTALLAESHSELVASRSRAEHTENEREQWQLERQDLVFHLDSNRRRVEDLERVNEAAGAHIANLEAQQRRWEVGRQALQEALAVLGETGEHEGLRQAVDRFLSDQCVARLERRGQAESAALEAKLRFAFESRFSDQLGLRIAHERKRVLGRLEMLCYREAPISIDGIVVHTSSTGSAPRNGMRPATSIGRRADRHKANVPGMALFPVLRRLVQDAYDDLNVSMGTWADTDLDALSDRIRVLNGEASAKDTQLTALAMELEAQRLALSRADLLQQEKDVLLAELTDRYRQLRAAEDARQLNAAQDEDAETPECRPLVVYGVPQPIEPKDSRRSPRSSVIPTRSRPMSAAATISSGNSASNHSRVPSASRLGSAASYRNQTPPSASAMWLDPRREDDIEPEHIRSVIKSKLMQQQQQYSGNQQDAPPVMGTDGVG